MPATAALNMALGQLITNAVRDAHVLHAMTSTPRERFVPPSMAGSAYVDEVLPLAEGRFILAPLTLARMLELAAIQRTDKVLTVGCGYGYSVAVIAHLAKEVIGCETDRDMAAAARRTLDAMEVRRARVAHVTSLASGYAADQPYDVVVVEGAVPHISPALLAMLREGGGLVAIEHALPTYPGVGARHGELVVYTKSDGHYVRSTHGQLSAPLLPGFTSAQGFVF